MSFCRSLAAIRISRLAFELPPSFPFGEERERDSSDVMKQGDWIEIHLSPFFSNCYCLHFVKR